MAAVLRESFSNLPARPSGQPAKAPNVENAAPQIVTAPPPPELNSAVKRSLESWFPLRQPLIKSRAGSGRATTKRSFNLQFRLPQPSEDGFQSGALRMSTPAPARTQQTVEQGREQGCLADDVLQALLQEARAVRRAALPRRAGSGRMVTKRPIDVTFQPVPEPPTPYCPTPEAPVEVASLPCTPGTALHALATQATARSTVGRRSRSASFDTPMEGVPERPGPVLQPKTPALVFTPIEGVPERLGPMLPATAARRRLHTTTPGPKRARPAGSAAADCRLLTPGDSAVLASGSDLDDQDSPVEGLLQRDTDVRNQASAAPGGSSSGSFAFSKAAMTPAPPPQHQLGSRLEQDGVDPLGFFAADGGRALHRRQGVDCLDSAPATSPWHLRDYNPSPQVHYPPQRPAAAQSAGVSLRSAAKRSSLGQPALASSLQPSPSAAHPPAADSDDDDDGFGGGGDDWDGEAGVGPECPSGGDGAEDAAMAIDEGSVERTPVPEDDPAAEAGALTEQGAEGAAAGPSRARRQPPVSCNKRLKREFRARKSLAGVGLQPSAAGRRRSTRVSCKPLDWWRNERKVYERKFHSLPTVDHCEVHTPTPTWQFVSDYKKKKTRARTK
ncbi:probable centromere protein C at C-terminar half [Coccomyxa sp. Obi]|nr:probable centromere protein C at C-terminar half [Coccomyxa sp. Obi]